MRKVILTSVAVFAAQYAFAITACVDGRIPETAGAKVLIAEAFRRASSERPTIEPGDWFETRVPTRWRDTEGTVTYKWNCP